MSKLQPQKLQIHDFSIEVPAKWVLSGEHSVLRGKQALAFPYHDFTLKLSYRKDADAKKELTISANPFQSQIKALIGRAFEWLDVRADLLDGGEIDIQSQIPIGAGLGSSAALSVAVARLALWKANASEDRWIPLATHLEDVFHGRSSGMDVNAIAYAQPILYSLNSESREQKAEVLNQVCMPKFKLYDSGKRGQTKECIEQVNAWMKGQGENSIRYDAQMHEATQMARHALHEFADHPERSLENLAKAMNLAQNCFETWGLITPELMTQKQELLKQGALAVKLTGAGLGGFWIALWK
jgi:mevalonate kinase